MKALKIDLTYLEEITGGEKEIMIELIDLFMSETPKHIEKLRTFYAHKEWDKLRGEVHKFKPTLEYVGLNQLKKYAVRAEEICCDEKNRDELKEIIDKIEAGFLQSRLVLEKKKVELNAQA